MMKNKIIMMSMLLLIGVSSCEKYVDDTANWGAISDVDVWKDAVQIELITNAWYAYIQDANPTRADFYYGAENSATGGSGWATGGVTGASRWGWPQELYFEPRWSEIRTINDFLANIDDAPADMPATQRAQLKGQAHFFLAWNYYKLVENFGGVPLLTEVQDVTGDLALLDVPRNTSLECFEFMEQQMDLAIANLPIRGNDGYVYGRIDKIAALAAKAKILRLKALPRFCNTKVDAYWQDAMDAVNTLKTEADAAGFGLATDLVDMWYDQQMMRDTELLMYEEFTSPGRLNLMQRPSSAGGNSGWFKLAWQAIKEYPMANGLSINDPASEYDEGIWSANRDPRLYVNITFNGQLWDFPDFPGNRTWMFQGAAGGGRDANNHGVTSRKFSNQNWDLATSRADRAFDQAYVRYTELLLWEAECALELGNASVAFDNIVLLRDRAGIPAGTGRYGLAAGVGSDYQETLDAIYIERGIELFMESHNYWDLINRNNLKKWRDWGQFELNEPVLNIPVFNALGLVDDDGAVTSSASTTSGEWSRIINALTKKMNSLSTQAERDALVKSITINDIRFVHPTNKITTPDYYVFAPYMQNWINKSPAQEQTLGWDTGTFNPRITD